MQRARRLLTAVAARGRRGRLATAAAAVGIVAVTAAFLVLDGSHPAAAGPLARNSGPTVLAFVEPHPTAPARGSLIAHLGHISAVAPASLDLRDNGTFAYLTPTPLVGRLAGRHAQIDPVLTDTGGRAPALLHDASTRRLLAMRLAVALRALGATGVVIDFETLTGGERRLLPDFLRELRENVGPSLPLLVTVPAITDGASARRGAGYDYRDLSRPALLVVRAWNQHSDATRPGPVASLAFFRAAVRYAAAHAPHSRLVIGVPTWGWRWPVGAPAERASQASLYPLAREQALQQPAGTRVRRGGMTAWFESDRSVQLKLEVARSARPAGIALWIRGGESSRLWSEPIVSGAAARPAALVAPDRIDGGRFAPATTVAAVAAAAGGRRRVAAAVGGRVRP